MRFLKINVCLGSEQGAIALRSFAALLHGFKLITNINLNARPPAVGPGVISRVPAPARVCGAACKLTGGTPGDGIRRAGGALTHAFVCPQGLA